MIKLAHCEYRIILWAFVMMMGLQDSSQHQLNKYKLLKQDGIMMLNRPIQPTCGLFNDAVTAQIRYTASNNKMTDPSKPNHHPTKKAHSGRSPALAHDVVPC
jgi:hypothetical protein